MKKIIIGAILTTGFVFNSYARTEQELKKDVYKVSSKIVTTYQNSGMGGVEESSQECWKEIEKQEFKCLYIDMAARYIDRLGGGGNAFPLNAYFDDEQFGTRAVSFFNQKKISMDNANMYMSTMQPVVNNAVDRALKLSQ